MKQAMLSNGPDLETTFYGLLSCVFPVRSENGNVMLGDIEIVATGRIGSFHGGAVLRLAVSNLNILRPRWPLSEADLVISPPLQGCLRLISTPRLLSVCDG